jgi:hypothetical protein
MKQAKKYTMVTFICCSETITRYFEGNARFDQINNVTGFCPIIDIQRVKGNFQADYVKANNLFGYTAA